MVELTKVELLMVLCAGFGMGAMWAAILHGVMNKSYRSNKTDKGKSGWKPCVTSNGMQVEISWTSHSSWRPADKNVRDTADKNVCATWGAE